MSTLKLSLPTQIPWKRVCVSRDMQDVIACDDRRPPRWRSSIAMFRYDPEEDYQPFEGERIAYLKVVCTVAPYQPDIDLAGDGNFVPPRLVDGVEESFPSYGAVLQVSVSPRAADADRFDPARYPYIADCEPKKRELYEAVSETGEVLSGSSSHLTIGKSATDTHSTENYDLDMGGGGGFSIGWGAVDANWSGQEQTGTVRKSGREVSTVHTSDRSTERRELQSHTTQLTQMYNLFQAFHVGTNRVLFLIEPRPHIRQTEATFINGPRSLEGVQEVFLVVVYPKNADDFCVHALLETAHLTMEPRLEVPRREQVHNIFFEANIGKNQLGDFKWVHTVSGDWRIDLARSGGYNLAIFEQEDLDEGPTVQVTANQLRLSGRLGISGKLRGELMIYHRKNEPEVVENVRQLFLSARDLCCCPEKPNINPDWIAAITDLHAHHWPVRRGLMTAADFVSSRRIAATIRHEMVRSFGSSRRLDRGALRYVASDLLRTRVRDLLALEGRGEGLRVAVQRVPGIEEGVRKRLLDRLGEDTVVDAVLVMPEAELARRVEMTPDEARRLKATLLRSLDTD